MYVRVSCMCAYVHDLLITCACIYVISFVNLRTRKPKIFRKGFGEQL